MVDKVFNDNRGQLSLEYILLLGLVLVLVLAIVAPLGKGVETDQAMAATKNGIINATNQLAYSNTGNIFRVNKINFNNSTGAISATVYSMKSPTGTEKTFVQTHTLSTISQTLNKPISGNSVLGSNYNYTLTINWVG